MTIERRMQTQSLGTISGWADDGSPKSLGQARSSQGMCQPPKNKATQTMLVVIMPAYSPRKKSAKRIAEYSVW
jgi:hypothetical protein